MSTALERRSAGLSPSSKARIAGLFELLEAITAGWVQAVVLKRLIVVGDAAATARDLTTHESLFRLGFASSLISVLFHIVWALLFYELFKAVNRRLSALAVYVILVGCAIQAFSCSLYLAPMLFLQNGSSSSAFTILQLQELALKCVGLSGQAFNVYLVFFGFWCILIGWLIFRSRFMPRVLGILLAISGLGWAMFIVPPFAHRLFPYIAMASALGEIPLQLWLLVFGVNNQKWYEQARTAEMGSGEL